MMKTDRRSLMVELPYPPSANRIWRNLVIQGSARTVLSAEGRAYQRMMEDLILPRAPRTFEGDLKLTVWIWYPDLRRRDLDNVLKALLDGCTKAGLWSDDRQIKSLKVSVRGIIRPAGKVILRVRELEGRLFV